jgi:two-component system, OmpR family, sensor histidine kinase ArlS
MKIKTRLTLNFTVLVAIVLAISSISLYIFSMAHRQKDFIARLRYKAINTATLLINVNDVDARLLKIIDDNTVSSLSDVNVFVLDQSKKVLYTNADSVKELEDLPLFSRLAWTDNNYTIRAGKLYLCVIHYYNHQQYYVLATARDYFGTSELSNLKIILFIVFFLSLIWTIVAGIINTKQSLKPIRDIIKQVDAIKATNLNSRLETRNKDEITELAATFNKLLDRIEKAFDTERTFVSNASHELRTPITSIKGQLEVALINPRSNEEYKVILHSILDDVQNMATIINGFLELAASSVEPGLVSFEQLRIDDILFSAKDDILKRKPGYFINIEFENTPDDENEITIVGNARLLKILIINLIDNACKFSDNKKVSIKIAFDRRKIILKFIDSGIGIPASDLENVFQPLYRAKNVTGKTGNGIGLSIVKRIIDLHAGNIEIESEVNIGTTVSVSFENTKFIN